MPARARYRPSGSDLRNIGLDDRLSSIMATMPELLGWFLVAILGAAFIYCSVLAVLYLRFLYWKRRTGWRPGGPFPPDPA